PARAVIPAAAIVRRVGGRRTGVIVFREGLRPVIDRLARPSPAAHKTWTGQDDGFRTALLTRPGWVRSATS
ncbi:MAG: hypothetical protein ABSF03_18770, partial [Streptosporangiaceae bacterium]